MPRVPHHRSRELRQDPADEAHRPREEIEQGDEPDQATEREPSGGHPPRPDQQQDRRDEGRERVEGRLERGPQEARLDPLVTERPSLDREPLGLGRLAPEGLHDQRAVDRLVGDGRDLADPLLRPRGGTLHPLGEVAVHHRESREHDRRDQREEEVGGDQLDHRQDDQHDHAGGERDRPEHVHRRLDVGLHVGQQLTGGGLAVVREREPPVPVRDPRAERRHHPLAGDAAEEPPQHDPERPEAPERHQRRDREPDLPWFHTAGERRLEHLVGGSAERGGEADRGEREQHRARDGDEERSRMHPDVGHDQAEAAPEEPFGRDVRRRRLCGRPLVCLLRRSRLRAHGHHPMMRTMTDHRPWFRIWRAGVPKTVAPFPHQSVFNLLVDSAAGFPDSTAIAFLGKHLNYRQLLHEVERFSAVLAGPRGQAGRSGRTPPPELTPVRDRVVRVPATQRDRGRATTRSTPSASSPIRSRTTRPA